MTYYARFEIVYNPTVESQVYLSFVAESAGTQIPSAFDGRNAGTGRDSEGYGLDNKFGNTIATAQAFSATKRGTTVLLFSVPKSGTTHPLSLEDVYQKELTIVGSIINPDTHQRAVDLINSGRIQLAPILTHRFPIERLKDAILMQMSSESLKVLVGSNYD